MTIKIGVDKHELSNAFVKVDGVKRQIVEIKVGTVYGNKSVWTNTTVPGSNKLLAGSINQGFYGEVEASELITGDALTKLVGVTEGISQYSNEPWLKFSLDGKILFKSKKPIRGKISWKHLDDCNVTNGKIIIINKIKYKVRLMKALNDNANEYNNEGFLESSGKNLWGSEWNKLILPISEKAKNHSWEYPKNVDNSEVPKDWGVNYSKLDLGFGTQWCLDTVYMEPSREVKRDVDIPSGVPQTGMYYWSPVLEVIK